MKSILAIILFLCCFISLFSQENTNKDSLVFASPEKEIILYKIWIIYDWPKAVKGVLYDIKDSSVIISNTYKKLDYVNGNLNLSEYNYKNIDKIKIQREYSVGRAILIGTIVAIPIGAIIAYNTSKNNDSDSFLTLTREQSAVLGGLEFGALGAALGTIYGSFKINIPINRNEENFRNNKNKIKKYTILNRY